MPNEEEENQNDIWEHENSEAIGNGGSSEEVPESAGEDK